LENRVPLIATTLLENLAVSLMTNVQQLVLENRVPLTEIVLLAIAVILITNVQLLVLENRVSLITTVIMENVMILAANVQQEIEPAM
jgi:hypothetical protein